MAVYTEVSFEEANQFLQSLALGTLQSMEGCSGGIENTNYFVTTDQGAYVLTLFERLSAEQLPFYLRLMKHLAHHGIPVPDPAANRDGDVLHHLNGKPAAVVNRLRGKSELRPDAAHCTLVGSMLARMHLAGRDYSMQQPNLRALPWWNETVPVVLPFLEPAQAALLQSELAYQNHVATQSAYGALPQGAIHADLFRDNVMFEVAADAAHTPALTGFFDFYFAGNDAWLFDIAVCLNDWCIDLETGATDAERTAAFLDAYTAVRPLKAQERTLLPAMARAGALRFWLSRLWDLHLPREASMLKAHDPSHFERVLRQRIQHPLTLPVVETTESLAA
ncbi:homoserine kinase [Rhodoferax saidenbachensis]|uniref:Homoserine kinase n=1 Tax=Rhodoferax saidenbachensis TaxID=1484693 RepID=A0A1P8K8A2_9BURK|nr:homoserine kinase [Rhodoferax saidenbachensis]APW42227.1 homoserine kinase [Rhodoferax saidenbachensis]